MNIISTIPVGDSPKNIQLPPGVMIPGRPLPIPQNQQLEMLAPARTEDEIKANVAASYADMKSQVASIDDVAMLQRLYQQRADVLQMERSQGFKGINPNRVPEYERVREAELRALRERIDELLKGAGTVVSKVTVVAPSSPTLTQFSALNLPAGGLQIPPSAFVPQASTRDTSQIMLGEQPQIVIDRQNFINRIKMFLPYIAGIAAVAALIYFNTRKRR